MKLVIDYSNFPKELKNIAVNHLFSLAYILDVFYDKEFNGALLVKEGLYPYRQLAGNFLRTLIEKGLIVRHSIKKYTFTEKGKTLKNVIYLERDYDAKN